MDTVFQFPQACCSYTHPQNICSNRSMTGEGGNPDRVPMREWLHSVPFAAHGGPVRRFEAPVRVRVWVLHPRHGWVQIEGNAVAYTAKAGDVEYIDKHGRTGSVWAWASGIERIGSETEPSTR